MTSFSGVTSASAFRRFLPGGSARGSFGARPNLGIFGSKIGGFGSKFGGKMVGGFGGNEGGAGYEFWGENMGFFEVKIGDFWGLKRQDWGPSGVATPTPNVTTPLLWSRPLCILIDKIRGIFWGHFWCFWVEKWRFF